VANPDIKLGPLCRSLDVRWLFHNGLADAAHNLAKDPTRPLNDCTDVLRQSPCTLAPTVKTLGDDDRRPPSGRGSAGGRRLPAPHGHRAMALERLHAQVPQVRSPR